MAEELCVVQHSYIVFTCNVYIITGHLQRNGTCWARLQQVLFLNVLGKHGHIIYLIQNVPTFGTTHTDTHSHIYTEDHLLWQNFGRQQQQRGKCYVPTEHRAQSSASRRCPCPPPPNLSLTCCDSCLVAS